MILNNNASNTIISEGATLKTSKMKMDQDSLAFIMKMVSTFYSDNKGSPIRETVSNGWDSHIKAGQTRPILVKLERNPRTYSYQFVVRDYGMGIDAQLVDDVISQYGKSTKREDDSALGCFGLGFKSGLSYTSAFYFTGWKDGVERKWIMREGEEETELDLLYEKESSEPTGAEINIPIKSYLDARDFSNKIREQLCYFSNVFIVDDYSPFNNDFKIFQTEDFKWSEVCPSDEMHLCLADVYYPLDWKKLGIDPIKVPVGLRFSLSEGIEPLPARESFKYSEQAKEAILTKIKKVATWFIERYNTTTHRQSMREVWDELGKKEHMLILEDKVFTINDLKKYSEIPVNKISVEGIKFRDPEWYKTNNQLLFNNYKILGYTSVKQGRWKMEVKENQIYKKMMEGWTVAEISYSPKDVERSYLNQKYSRFQHILIKEKNEREIGDEFYHLDVSDKAGTFYRNMLELSTFPEDTWENRILEFLIVEEEFKKDVIDEKRFMFTEEYNDWYLRRKAEIAANRTYSGGGKGSRGGKDKQALNKQKGEITIGWARDHVHKKNVVFDKTTVQIKDLHKLKHLTVYFTAAEVTEQLKEDLYEYRKMFRNVKFALLNDSEVKHVQNLINIKEKDKNKKKSNPFITFKQFKMSKPFARLATALLVEDIFNMEPNNKSFIYKAFPKYEDLRNRLQTYEREHNYYRTPSNLKKIILQECLDTNNWDFNIYSEVKEFEQIIKKFSFLEFLDVSSQFEDTDSVVKNMIYIMLKGQRINDGLVEDFELVPKVPVEVLQENYALDLAVAEMDEALDLAEAV